MSSRKAFIETYCDGNKENRTQGLANKIASICKHAAGGRSKKSPSLKSFLTYFFLKYFDHLPHNIKVYGISYIFGKRLDKFGRYDKHFHNIDIERWKRILAGELN